MEHQVLLKRKRKAEGKDDVQLALACNGLANYYQLEGKYEKALKEYKQEAELYNRTKDRLKYAVANRMIGEVYLALEEFDDALRHIEIFLKIAVEFEDKIEIQRAETTLGRAYLLLYQVNENKGSKIVNRHKALIRAEKSFLKSLLMCKELIGKVSAHEMLDMKARLCLNLSITKEHSGELDKAQEYLEKAINMCKSGELYEILHQCYMAKSALCITKLVDQGAAMQNANLALEVAERLSNRAVKCCETLIAKGNILIKSGDFQSAKQVLTKAYKLRTPIDADRELIESNLRTVAALCKIEDELIVVYAGDYKKRRELYEKMGDGSCKLGNYEKAVIYYEQMLENAKLNGEKGRDLCAAYVSLYKTYQDLKAYRKAIKYMQDEYNIVKDNPNEAIDTLLQLAEVTALCGDDCQSIYDDVRMCVIEITERPLQRDSLAKLIELFTKKGEARRLEELENDIQHLGFNLEELKTRKIKDLIDNESDDEAVVDTPDIGDDICLDDLTDSGSDVDHDEEETKDSKRSSVRRRTAVSSKIKRNDKGETELHKACISGNIPYVKRLLSAGHPLNVRDNVGWMPLHEASNYGYKEIVRLLLDHGGNMVINDRAENGGITPLHDACSNGHFDIIEMLLDNGANPTIRTDDGETALSCLTAWRGRANGLDSVEDSHYDIIRVRLSEALKKVGLPETVQTKSRPRKPLVPRVPNKQKVTPTVVPRRSSTEKVSKIGNLRKGIVDDEDSSNDSLLDQPRRAEKNTEATAMYKSAISNLKTNFNQPPTNSKASEDENVQKKRSAYLQSEEVDDDWLDVDVPIQEKKKRRFASEYVSPRKKLSLSLGRKDSSKRSHESDVEEIPSGTKALEAGKSSRHSADAFDVIMSSKQQGQGRTRKNSIKSRSSAKGSGGGGGAKNQTSLLQAGFSRAVDDDDDSDNEINDSGITSPIKSSHSSTTTGNPVNPSGFITLKVKIEDQLIVVPVRMAEAPNLTMKWLAESATKRYENIHGRVPFLSLCTTDGAVFDQSDPLEIVMDIKPYISTTIHRWSKKALAESYVACTKIVKQDVNNSILSRLQANDSQNVVDLHNLYLVAADMEPLLKALQFNSEVIRLDLSNNFIDDQGVINVCQTLSSLSKLKSLNLSGNLIAIDGLMKMDNWFSQSRMQLTELTDFKLSFNNITDEGVKYLFRICNTFPRMSQLSLKSCNLSTIGSLNLCFEQLVSLDLSHNSFRNLRSLWDNLCLDKIKELNFNFAISPSYTEFPKELITFLKSKSSRSSSFPLEMLSLSNCNINDANLWELLQVLSTFSLRQLNLMNNAKLSSLSFKYLVTSKLTLEELNLRGCPQILGELDCSTLSEICVSDLKLPKRLSLSLLNTDSTDSILRALKQLWSSHCGFDRFKFEHNSHTLVISTLLSG